MKSVIIFSLGIFVGETIAVILLALCSTNDKDIYYKEEKDGVNDENN